jgi:PAS domain S-box-containing protein
MIETVTEQPSTTAQILIVEDESIIASDLRDRLLSWGHQVVGIASSGEEALRDAAELRPDLILMDVRLPGGVDGVNAARTIRSRLSIPVIYLTAFSNDETLQRAKETEPYGYITKPVRDADLRSAIVMALYKHRMETQLRQREQLLETTLRSIGDAVAITDVTERVTLLNSVAERLTGWSGDDAKGRPAHEVLRLVSEATRQPVDSPITRALRSGHIVKLPSRTLLVGRNGRTIPLDDSAAPIRDEQGGIAGCVMVFRDVTEQRKAEEGYRAAEREAKEANRIKDDFLATLSHELRTPLTAILGWSSMLAGGRIELEASAKAIQIIARNARHLAQLVDDVLDVSRIVSGSLRMAMAPLDLASVVEAALETIRPAAEAKSVELRVNLEGSDIVVAGDPARLQQVMWNLCSNAVKFTPSGGQVHVTLERRGSEAGIVVADTGRGIRPEFLPFVFDRFRQADSATTRNFGGLGLGLAIVRYLVELHGGSVHAESGGENLGATFTVTLPVRVRAPHDRRAPTERLSLPPVVAGFRESQALHGVTVLIIDDDGDTRELLQAILCNAGAEAIVAASAKQAIEVFDRRRPALILSDIGMPGEDGYALIRRIRNRSPEEGGLTPAVALTAHARADDRSRSLRAGFQYHLAKPVAAADLLAVVLSLVTGTSSARETVLT